MQININSQIPHGGFDVVPLNFEIGVQEENIWHINHQTSHSSDEHTGILQEFWNAVLGETKMNTGYESMEYSPRDVFMDVIKHHLTYDLMECIKNGYPTTKAGEESKEYHGHTISITESIPDLVKGSDIYRLSTEGRTVIPDSHTLINYLGEPTDGISLIQPEGTILGIEPGYFMPSAKDTGMPLAYFLSHLPKNIYDPENAEASEPLGGRTLSAIIASVYYDLLTLIVKQTVPKGKGTNDNVKFPFSEIYRFGKEGMETEIYLEYSPDKKHALRAEDLVKNLVVVVNNYELKEKEMVCTSEHKFRLSDLYTDWNFKIPTVYSISCSRVVPLTLATTLHQNPTTPVASTYSMNDISDGGVTFI